VGPSLLLAMLVSQGMAGAVGPGSIAGHVGSQGMAGVLLLRLLGRHVGSQGMTAGDDPGLLTSMFVPGAWRELWARG